ncbi:MAG: radical SAM protein [Acidobacteriota bacterium]
MQGVLQAWGRILKGYRPLLSIEITSKCPLSCPGCYAYGEDHLGGEGIRLSGLRDFHGQQLIDGVMGLIDEHRPLHVSIIGGEPLVRHKELSVILPMLAQRGVHAQVVTSAVTRVPIDWASIPNLSISVSIDGLQPEHDARRKPATYERIIENIQGHRVTVHCTITRQQVQRDDYLEEFVRQWSAMDTTRRIWISLYTPQVGEVSEEMLLPEDREAVVGELKRLHRIYPKLDLGDRTASAYASPPGSPGDCIFARTTDCVSADLTSRVVPCQFGGDPDCSQCGCMASAALTAAGRYRLAGVLPVDALFSGSLAIGEIVRRRRRRRDPIEQHPDGMPQASSS